MAGDSDEEGFWTEFAGLPAAWTEEVEALRAIYGGEGQGGLEAYKTVVAVDLGVNGVKDFTATFTYCSGYPAKGPAITIDGGWLNGSELSALHACVGEAVQANLGEPMLFALVDWMKDNAREAIQKCQSCQLKREPSGDAALAAALQERELREAAAQHKRARHAALQERMRHVEIHSGPVTTDRKSRFQAHVAAVATVEEVSYVIESLRSDSKILDAAHPTIYAYRFTGPNGQLFSHRDDDGETGAADKLLFLLDAAQAKNVIVVVTRWFGGVHLGPDRFKHINTVARDLLQEHNYINRKEDPPKGKAAKK